MAGKLRQTRMICLHFIAARSRRTVSTRFPSISVCSEGFQYDSCSQQLTFHSAIDTKMHIQSTTPSKCGKSASARNISNRNHAAADWWRPLKGDKKNGRLLFFLVTATPVGQAMLELDRKIYIFLDRWFSALTCMHTLDTRVIHKDRDANIISPSAQTEKSVNVETLKTNKNSISLIKVSGEQFKIPHRTHFSRALFYFNLTVFAFGLQSNVLIYYFAPNTFRSPFPPFHCEIFPLATQLKWTSVPNANLKWFYVRWTRENWTEFAYEALIIGWEFARMPALANIRDANGAQQSKAPFFISINSELHILTLDC